MGLIGRHDECRTLDELVEAVRTGHSRALLVRGEAGIGKSALLTYAQSRASGLRVLRTTGIPAESELPFAGLHQLFGSLADRIDGLPAPQRDALRVAFGLADGSVPDRYVVALGLLRLLADLARERPVLCLVDDEQWLDRPTVLALSFVARRIDTEAVGFVFASREDAEDFRGIPTLALAGLSARAARELFDSVLTGPLDPSIRNSILTESRGNPLALLEWPRGVGPVELAGGFRFPGVVPLPFRIEATYRQRLDALPAAARQFLLLAAADAVGDPTTLWAAASRLGLEPSAVTPALASGLLAVGARVEFGDALARAAIYRAADIEQRRLVHDALAAVAPDPDRRAWHRANATPGLDEQTADELERSADRAQARGGLAAAAAFLERAAALTVEPELRTRRMIAAAEATRDSGAHDAALALLESVESRPLDDDQAARAMRIRGLIAIEQHRREEGVDLVFAAANRFADRNSPEARETSLEALIATFWAAEPHDPLLARAAAAVAETVRRSAGPPNLTDLLLRGLYVRITEGFAASAPILQQAVDVLVAAAPSARWSVFGVFRQMLSLTEETWDEEAWGTFATRQIVVCRREGALALLSQVLNWTAFYRMHEGDLLAARALLDESNSVAAVTTGRTNRHVEAVLHAWCGDEEETRKFSDEVRRLITAQRGLFGFCADYADAVLANSLGQFHVALEAAKRAFESDQVLVGSMVVTELLDAAWQTGAVGELRVARKWLAERAVAIDTPWMQGIHQRSLALLAEDDAAEEHHLRSIELLGATRSRIDTARAHLLFGEWLERRGRRDEAHEHLREAHQMFQTLGAVGFAVRAEGDAVQQPTLTEQEAQIAALASQGLSNPEIGARLFISRRTVQYHLRKVFAKLGITSRAQLPSEVSLHKSSTASGFTADA
ncbi:AAA family ATPase [Cryptosporangium sp. NPDC048952]|uniref:AAA family ATPase n=1 Tax=Cryptosporangium sp. NPDC048952 TaxID=3363961 RepID=UPI00372141D4